ncbi:MAG: TOBE domain-containing protein [Desulfovibrionaceae bacterium]|nr:TOBE domain-containing protein [Desulfovibrionaceae bacterium]
MKQLTSKDLHILTEAWETWTRSAPNESQLRSRERLLLVFLLIRHGALRLSEALQINDLKDFDYPTGTIRIGGPRGREVQIPEKAMKAVSALVNSPRMMPLRGSITRMDQGYVRKRFYAMSELCGLPPEAIGPQVVRQARATELLQANIPLNIVQKFLGQRSPVQAAGFISFTDDDARRIVHNHLRQEALKRSSARNAFTGNVTRLETGPVSALVEITTLQGMKVHTLITIESVQRLNIHPGQLLNTTVKAPFVMLARPGGGCDGTNRFRGRVSAINRGAVESSVVVDVAEGASLCSILSTDELELLGLSVGDEAEAFFSPFASVLGLPED